MKFPKRLRIKGNIYRVRLASKRNLMRNSIGLIDTGTREIKIWRELDEDMQWITLIHEILHACWPKNVIPIQYEEIVIDKMDRDLWEALRDNFELG